jgi:hypothetical protein
MNEYLLYLRLGFEHIIDPKGYDHLLFIAAFSLGYRLSDYKQLLLLITAFTLGHSLTLILAITDLITIPSRWVEVFIPITILFTVVNNWNQQKSKLSYLLIFLFGLIHGLGFSGYLSSILGAENLLIPLFSFNCGLELGQLLIVAACLLFFQSVVKQYPHPQKAKQLLLIPVLMLSLWILFERIVDLT